jgi:hypothetical protein
VKVHLCKDRPHPDPLPQERGKLFPRFGNVFTAGFATKPCEEPGTSKCSPSLGGEGRGEGERQSIRLRITTVVVSLLVAGLTLLCLNSPAFAQTDLIVINQSTNVPTVGMEGGLDVALPLAGLITKPGDHRAPLVLRIAATQPYGTLTRYELRYTGRVPGQHDLRNYLFTADGLPATNLPALQVNITGLLPNPHSGWLEEQAHRAPSLFRSYRVMLVGVAVLWVAAFFILRRLDRKPKTLIAPVATARPPSFAEKIRPLVERAAAGQLCAEEKATLERMLITHWQQRLNLIGASTNDLIHQLRQHPEAGVLLRALEDWLHRPPGSAAVHVEEFLAPYCNLPEPQPAEART